MIKKLFIISILFLFLILMPNCSKPPEGAFKVIDEFFLLRNQGAYIELYNMFHSNFKKDVSIEEYIRIERIYRDKIGLLKNHKLKKWNERKNFSCGSGSGRMVAVIHICQYSIKRAEETFTMIKKGNTWEIFDYYLRPM